ncbi:ABC transporter permease [Clostridium luticellarii]|jgi:bacitracin transport system permease protein|uniref:ABC-2 family transporter protein n=1 Tax=Clostridium luticellarii TaxID=1691940 RepID=A0A2T0BM14_9CLOT|nr:ABC transporter permease [Clostridium luticellarii]CAB1239291.1 ABC-2 family transporter protein [Clostridiaceae bacterium BL-3]MCI1946013.1 ABC transporter permease [Clostridium luticellarii]MCI1969357.1 ABC transporter permease [Clostridium luticellarii]MCI1996057.1 ABC transporter permease [Clostridium luticellarii]MCI2040696.1 ABC transporter permease [Clostridium luticellarii]
MFNIIYGEFLKLKRSYLIIASIIASIFIPLVQCVMSLSNDYTGISDALKSTLVKDYRTSTELLCFQFLYIIFFAFISGYIFSREFSDKTANVLYSYPFGRIKIFAGKLIAIYLIILFVYICQFAAVYAALYIAWGELPSLSFIITDIKVNLYSMLFQFLIISIPVFIGIITKNIVFPLVYGILAAVSSSFFMAAGGIYLQMSPLMLPSLPIYFFYKGDPIDFILLFTNIIFILSISILFCIYCCKFMDME